MKKLVLITLSMLSFSFAFPQIETNDDEIIEEIVIESTEINVNSFYSKSTTDIVTGEIDNTLLIFKGRNTSLYGIKDKNNKVLVKPIFNSISTYGSTKDRIQARFDWKKNGVIDSKGTIIIPFEYSNISKNKNQFIVTQNNEKRLLDYYGKSLLKNSYEDISFLNQNYIKVKSNGLYGLLKLNGDEVFPIEYEEINHYSSQDWFLLNQNGKTLLKDSQGKRIFGKEYTNISKIDYNFRYILAEKNGKYGIINKSNDIVAPFIFDTVSKEYDNRLFTVQENGKWGIYSILFDAYIVKPEYDGIKKISSGYYVLDKGSSKTFINLLSNIKVDFSNYDKVNNYVSYNIVRVENNGLKGGANANSGKLIIPLKYDYLDISSNYVKARLPNTKLSDVYDTKGKLLFSNVTQIKRLKDYYYRVSSKGKVGVISRNKIIVDAKYDFIKSFKNLAVFLVKDKEKYGLIDYDNQFLIPLDNYKININEAKNIINWKGKNHMISLGKLVELKK